MKVVAELGQAAGRDITNEITGLIGQLSGHNTVVIHNININTAPEKRADRPAGLIAYFGLSEWWLERLSEGERAAIEDSIGADVAVTVIHSTSRSAQCWLRSVALRIGAAHPKLASKVRAKATAIETGVEVDDYWQKQMEAIRRHWLRMDFDAAREELRAVAYRMREENALPEDRAAFDELQAKFIRADPYYADVMAVVLPIIRSRPGVIQSALAKACDFDVERFRSAMYYGELLGDIKRVKSGRSYGLFPTGE